MSGMGNQSYGENRIQRLTKQMKEWLGDFGRDYTDRNSCSFEELDKSYLDVFGVNRSDLNLEFVGGIDRSANVLEVGANIGLQLQGLQRMGFRNLYGIELQWYAVEMSKSRTKNINLIQGNAFDIPFKDGCFDLVFTSGVLIHISPTDTATILEEIYRCSKKFIWGFEYYSPDYVSVRYRGKDSLLWKANFVGIYLRQFPDLRLVKERFLKWRNSENVDVMFLLDKT